MADTRSNKSEQNERGQQGAQSLVREDRPARGVQRWDRSTAGPFELMDRMTEEMDRVFDRMFHDFGFPRRFGLSRGALAPASRETVWAPRIEAFQAGDRYTVRAELPGLKKDDVHVELTNDALTIRGERKHEHEEERGGYYHSEREYGEFYRTVPLPEGVIGESAQASFRDGVLEVTMQAAPSEANRGRRLEIKDASEGSNPKK